jgi:exosortase
MDAGRTRHTWQLLAVVGFGAALFWTYWPTLTALVKVWLTDSASSHGFLVPVFSAAMLWARRADWSALEPRPSWLGVPLLVAAGVMHAVGGYYYSPWLDQMSLIPALMGICLSLGGPRSLRLAGPAVAFLVFMFPLPGRLERSLAAPLQTVATLASTNVLQTFGFFAQAEGNVIVLSDYELGVVEACSGLKMLTVFVATCTGVAVLIRRSLLQRLIIVASAFPIAILCNVIRISSTGMIHETLGHETANLVYHGVAGWLMAPLCLMFLGIELFVLRRLLTAPAPRRPRPAPARAAREREIRQPVRVG